MLVTDLLIAFRNLPEGCGSETMLEIENWDCDRFTPDDRIGWLRVKMGDLVSGSTMSLMPASSSQIAMKFASFLGANVAA